MPVRYGAWSYSYDKNQEINNMFRTHQIAQSAKIKNLKSIDFNERDDVEKIIDELIKSAKDPYSASLPLIASAELGDEKRYEIANSQMLQSLEILEKIPDKYPQWMHNNSFKAWMWGRVLSAADSMNDAKNITHAKSRLSILLEMNTEKDDNFAFLTWAWGYRAALNQTEYAISNKKMINDAMQLAIKYKLKPENHEALSDTLWAWVMNLSAAANAWDQIHYDLILEQIRLITGEKSIAQALEKGLLRTSDSNDYPAWALAKIRFAAAIMGDKELYNDIEGTLVSSVAGAKKAGADAEYILSIVDSQLAMLAGKELQ
jgi:hypothetical protein